MVNQTIYATSTQESRPILTGLNFKIDNDTLECIATDSYRLAKKTIKLDKKVDNPINIVIPGKNIGELVKIINDEDEKIHIIKMKESLSLTSIKGRNELSRAINVLLQNLGVIDAKISVSREIVTICQNRLDEYRQKI
jgi:DNA polymerase III sliding clamp (beta) subunit (PCNA family)